MPDTQKLRYPALYADNLYHERGRAAIDALCTPLHAAGNGDIIGVVGDGYIVSDDTFLLTQLRHVATAGADGPESGDIVDVDALAASRRARVAERLLALSGPCGVDLRPLTDAAMAASPEDAEIVLFEILLTPDAALVIQDNALPELNSIKRVEDGGLRQSHVNRHLHTVLPATGSAHAKLARVRAIERAAAVFDALYGASFAAIGGLAPPRPG